jgi:hypothetical protein
MSALPGNADARLWPRASYAYAILLALGCAYFLIRMPYQISDDLEHLLIFQFQTLGDVIRTHLTGVASMRPGMWVTQKVLFDLAPSGRYLTTFKTFHVAELVLLTVLFVRLLRVRTGTDLIALPVTLAALFGIHTFNVTIREGYPVNHFMSVLVCCLAAANLADARPRWWLDVLAPLIALYALFTIESGVLVWVCIVTAYIAGWRGVSRKGVVASTVVLAIYLVVRFALLDVGTRTIGLVDSGYGFQIRSPAELNTLFGSAPWKFYLYNIVSAALTVMVAEPRNGVFQFTRFVLLGDVPAWSLVNVAVSTIGTILIALTIARRIRRWTHWSLDRDDGVLLLFLGVFCANAAICYPYLKEVVLSPAGMFYAAALFVALRELLERARLHASMRTAILLAIPLLVLSAGWTLRAANLVETMRETAFVNRNDWAVAEEREDEVRPGWRMRHPDAERLVADLKKEIVTMPVPQPYMLRARRGWFDPY